MSCKVGELFLSKIAMDHRHQLSEKNLLILTGISSHYPRELDDLDGREDELDLENQLLLEEGEDDDDDREDEDDDDGREDELDLENQLLLGPWENKLALVSKLPFTQESRVKRRALLSCLSWDNDYYRTASQPGRRS